MSDLSDKKENGEINSLLTSKRKAGRPPKSSSLHFEENTASHVATNLQV
jgi:hypothetical protein